MSITTKKGDEGFTSLYGGGRVSKDSVRIEASGTLDELCSFLGLARSAIKDRRAKTLLESIQKDLFTVIKEISTRPKFTSKLKQRIELEHIHRLEKEIEDIEKKIEFKKSLFIPSGKTSLSSVLDTTRAVARRAERRVVTLKRKRLLKNPYILIYLNRLSDLLYLLSRIYE
jgi:ATP:cob(I)alamin adenosyltransferase